MACPFLTSMRLICIAFILIFTLWKIFLQNKKKNIKMNINPKKIDSSPKIKEPAKKNETFKNNGTKSKKKQLKNKNKDRIYKNIVGL